ncbi:MAG: bifunctional alpha,alpha-trehalose-phosphate synthase (UDP-forming)/trehalose-phosphatase, partial [Chloroflexota bacterium]
TGPDTVTKVDVFPMGIDYERFAGTASTAEADREIKKLDESFQGRKVVLSVDRLDYSKGILRRLEAFGAFLEDNPDYRERLTYVVVVVPSRTGVARYALLKRQIDEMIGAINGKYGTIGWTPIWYIYRSVPFQSLVALYRRADVALVTPLRDGMNLVAKEYLASKIDKPGVLILSETAGSAKELGEALIVNVNNTDDIVSALKEALEMSEAEQAERLRILQRRLRRYTVKRWAEDFMETLENSARLREEMGAHVLGSQARRKLIKSYQQAQRRLLLLDYDGTLAPFSSRPHRAVPSQEVLDLLTQLTSEPNTTVVLISGRDRKSLQDWFGRLPMGMIAEHGVWLKSGPDAEWEMIEPMSGDWKDEVRPIFELYADRTPGSFVEEKDFSLVWQYRRSESLLGELRARDLVVHLQTLVSNLDLQVLEGNKVVEVKNSGVNKGRAALRWIANLEPDFILAIGDDFTDEDTFRALPEEAWSLRVGLGSTSAKYNLSSQGRVVPLLRDMLATED